MRGDYEQRLRDYNMCSHPGSGHEHDARHDWEQPLTTIELAAAKAQGCAGCVWFSVWTGSGAHRRGDCRHAANQSVSVLTEDDRTARYTYDSDWCSEWRGEPTKEG